MFSSQFSREIMWRMISPRVLTKVWLCALAVALCHVPSGLSRRIISSSQVEVELSEDGQIIHIEPPDSYPVDIVKISREDNNKVDGGDHLQQTTEMQPTEKSFPPNADIPVSSDEDVFPRPDHLKSHKVNSNPLIDQKNLSLGKKHSKTDIDVIQGSRKAFTITKIEYLRKERCKTERLMQVIRVEGCRKRTIMNRFCYGQCNSFFIPKSGAKGKNSAAFQSCSFCKPRRTSWVTVTLLCPRSGGKQPRMRRKKVQMIKSCKCMAQKFS